MSTDSRSAAVLAGLAGVRGWQEEHYRDLHRHSKLSHQEHRTTEIVAKRLRGSGFSVDEGVGGTGVVGVLRGGDSPVVLLRADMDGDARLWPRCPRRVFARGCAVLADGSEYWNGTVIALFQPAEQVGDGARAMVDDRLGELLPTVDPVVLAAMILVRLQTVISRETVPSEPAVLTVGRIVAGSTSNVIADLRFPRFAGVFSIWLR